MTTKVVHCKHEPYDVYIGRPSQWGNPFAIGRDGDRDEVIEKYRRWLAGEITVPDRTPPTAEEISALRDKVLGCWCAPRACHGDVLAALADQQQETEHSTLHSPHTRERACEIELG